MATIEGMKHLVSNNYSSDSMDRTDSEAQDTIARILEQELIISDENQRRRTRIEIRRESFYDENPEKKASVLKRLQHNEEVVDATIRFA